MESMNIFLAVFYLYSENYKLSLNIIYFKPSDSIKALIFEVTSAIKISK